MDEAISKDHGEINNGSIAPNYLATLFYTL